MRGRHTHTHCSKQYITVRRRFQCFVPRGRRPKRWESCKRGQTNERHNDVTRPMELLVGWIWCWLRRKLCYLCVVEEKANALYQLGCNMYNVLLMMQGKAWLTNERKSTMSPRKGNWDGWMDGFSPSIQASLVSSLEEWRMLYGACRE